MIGLDTIQITLSQISRSYFRVCARRFATISRSFTHVRPFISFTLRTSCVCVCVIKTTYNHINASHMIYRRPSICVLSPPASTDDPLFLFGDFLQCCMHVIRHRMLSGVGEPSSRWFHISKYARSFDPRAQCQKNRAVGGVSLILTSYPLVPFETQKNRNEGRNNPRFPDNV